MSAVNVARLWPWLDHPLAGRAIAATQCRLEALGEPATDALQLLRFAIDQSRLNEEGLVTGDVLSLIAHEQDHIASHTFRLLWIYFQVERLKVLMLSVGLPFDLPADVKQMIKDLTREPPAEGGAA